MSDIVERLREIADWVDTKERASLLEAADEIERLRIAAPNVLFYKEQAEYWRGIAKDQEAVIRAVTL